jgi:malate dehydrogenase
VVRHDPTGPEPGQESAGEARRRTGEGREECRHLGQSLRHAVPRLRQRPIGGKPVPEVITDHEWLRGDFITTVQKRGAAIIEARGQSSAASAASAAIDTVVSLMQPTANDDCASVAVTSHGEYGVPEGLTFGFPITSDGAGAWRVKEGFDVDDFAKDRIKVTTDELLSERDEVRSLGLI